MTVLEDVRTIQQALLSEARFGRRQWWCNLLGEVRQKHSGAFLAHVVAKHLGDAGLDCAADRLSCAQNFFSRSVQSGVDRRYCGIGIEEKCAPLSPGTLIDGTISRGLVWVLGDPQGIHRAKRGALGLIVALGNKRIRRDVAELYFPVLEALEQLGVYHLIVNGNTGEHWPRRLGERDSIPEWLSDDPEPWSPLARPKLIAEIPAPVQSEQVAFGRHLRFAEVHTAGTNVAHAKCRNQWRMLDVGLLLRAKGYDAVRVRYDGPKLTLAGKGVEKRVADGMWKRFGVMLDWGVDVG